MEQEKKYSAKEAAIAVLKKAEEVLKNSQLLKTGQDETTADPQNLQKAEDVTPSDDVREQTAPSKNPAEEREGNNQGPGVIPHNEGENYKGYIKLARFMGHIDSKRKKKKEQ